MTIFKCKMCGGDLDVTAGATVVQCKYCDTMQTLPRLNDERRANLYDRANHFRRNNDYDKAMGIYDQILNEDATDAEAYWSIVLCRYGIEYVEDPATCKRIPTVNRAQFTSVLVDEDYRSALQYADVAQREIYEAEANSIDDIQKGILSISQKEEPFDVFVCYKETDANGRRTQDSVLAQELYYGLKNEGFKVFFSRITLEDKLGTAYEPYIFAALNSAKVMVVLGTRPDYFSAVWVKNEWSRYLSLIKQGQKKILIPAYRDMNPYDLPEEFSHLQAQDMSKLGFMQDLIYGIKKIVTIDGHRPTVVKETLVAVPSMSNTGPLLKRAFMFLEDGDFESADEYCEKVLDQDPESAQAYLGKLMVEMCVQRRIDLANCEKPLDNSKNYQKAIRFGDATLVAELEEYLALSKDRSTKKAEEERKEILYLQAIRNYKSPEISRIENAMEVFISLAGYMDSEKFVRVCETKIEQIRVHEENEKQRLAEEHLLEDSKAQALELKAVETEKRMTRIMIALMTILFVFFIVVAIWNSSSVYSIANCNNVMTQIKFGYVDESAETIVTFSEHNLQSLIQT